MSKFIKTIIGSFVLAVVLLLALNVDAVSTYLVQQGGTGVGSFTAYAPIFGGTTSTGNLQSGTVGSSGQLLTSNGAGALPTFQTLGTVAASSALTVQDAASDTTTFLGLWSDATGSLPGLTDSALTYNSSTNQMGIGLTPQSTWGFLQVMTDGAGATQYRNIVLADNATNNANKGGMLMGAPYAIANKPWTGFGTYTTSTEKAAYFGGGGWTAPDANALYFYTASAYNETNNQGILRMKIDPTGNVGIGTLAGTIDRPFHVEVADSGTAAVVYQDRMSHITSGTATTGFGAGTEYELENGSGTNKVAASQEFSWSDATNATEDTTYSLKLARAGTLTEALAIDSVSNVDAVSFGELATNDKLSWGSGVFLTGFSGGDPMTLTTNGGTITLASGASSANTNAIAFTGSRTNTSGTVLGQSSSFSLTPSGAGSAVFRPVSIAYTLDGTAGAQSGTATGIYLNATETTLNGMLHNLLNLNVGGTSKFLVDNAGSLTSTGTTILLDSAGTSTLANDRGANTNFASNVFRTAGTDEWTIGLRNDSTENLYIRDNINSVNILAAAQGSTPAVTAGGTWGFSSKATANANLDLKNGATTAGVLTFYEDTDDGSNYTSLKASAQSADLAYTLPNAYPVGSGYSLVSTTGGAMSWSNVSGSTPGGSDTYVQFNDSSTFGGDSGMAFNKTTDALTVAGKVVTPTIESSSDLTLISNAVTGTSTFTAGVGTVISNSLASGYITIGSATQTATTALGLSTKSNTINIGNANTENALTQTINMGAGTPAGTGKAVISIGNLLNATSVAINSGTGGINLTSGTTGTVNVLGTTTQAGQFRLYEDADDGSNYTSFKVPTLAADVAYTLPPDDGDSGEQLQTDGSGVLTWETAGGGGSATNWNDIGDATGDGVIALAGNETDWTSTLDAAGKSIFTLTNTDADTANDTDFISLAHNDGADANIFYFRAVGDLDGTPQTDYLFSQTAATIRPDLALTSDLTVTGGDIVLGTTSIFSGGDTASLNNIDAVDATTETTFEAAIDTLANLTSIQGQTVTLAGAFITSGANSLTLTTTGATNVTLPTTGTLATLAGTEEFTNKTLNASVGKGTWTASGTWTLPAFTLGGTITSNGQSFSGTLANLGTVTTADINGGTLDGTVIGGASAAAGTFTLATADGFAPTATTATGNRLYLPAANTLGLAINGTGEVQLTGTALSPIADGGNSFGTTALGWQNLFANTGFVINIENGDWVATHTAGILTVGTGDLRVTNNFTNATSVATLGGAQTFTNKTLTSPVINTGTIGTSLVPTSNDGAPLGNTTNQFSDLFLAEGGVLNWDNGDMTLTQTGNELVMAGGNLDVGANIFRRSGDIDIDGTPNSDDTFTGDSTDDYNAGATIAQWDVVYLDSSSTWQLIDADAAATAGPVMIGVATAAGTNGNPLKVCIADCFIRNDGWTSWTIGGVLYLSTTPGGITQTQPSGTDDVIRVIGHSTAAKTIYFNPSNDYITHT